MLTLRVPKDAVHPRLAVALGLAVASARHELHEAQHCGGDEGAAWHRGCAPGHPRPPPPPWNTPLTLVTGAAQLAEGEMVPVLIVRLLGACGTDGILVAATFGGDVCA